MFALPFKKAIGEYESIEHIQCEHTGFVVRSSDGSNHTIHWCGQDTEENYAQNIDRLKEIHKTYFIDTQIDYVLNDYGFRGNWNLEDVQTPGIVALGDSNTFGIGNKQEDLYQDIVGRELNLPVYNFGIQGSNLEVCFSNSIALVKQNIKPKLVIVQHSEIARKSIITGEAQYNGDMRHVGVDHNFTTQQLEVDVKQQVYTDYYVKGLIAHGIDSLWKSQGVPVVHFTFNYDGSNPSYFNCLPNFCSEVNAAIPYLARDMAHDGPETHLRAARYILNEIKGIKL